jgi:predicted NUDIX family phosphoesterase
MKRVEIKKLNKKIIVQVLNEEFFIPIEIKEKIEEYWKTIIKQNPKYFRGPVFCVKEVTEGDNEIRIILTNSDYAHYIYDMHNELEENYKCKNFWAGTIVETMDNKYIVGIMEKSTSVPNKMQISGGNIDRDEIHNNIVNIEKCAKRELKEELAIDVDDKQEVNSFDCMYLSNEIDKNSIGVIYKARINYTSDEMINKFNEYKKYLEDNNLEVEFNQIMIIDKKDIIKFFEEYIGGTEDTVIPVLLEDSKCE